MTDVRKYSSSVIIKSGSIITHRSELKYATTTVTLAGQRATLTLQNPPSDGETHWELWAASDDDSYGTVHYVGEAAVASTIEDNNTSLTGVAPAEVGTYMVPPAAKYLVADDARIIMAGSWETAVSTYGPVTPSNRRIWWTPVLADRDISDDERIVITTTQKNYADVEENITGLGGPINGRIYVFAFRRTWVLVPTGLVSAPYRKYTLSRSIGCIDDRSIVMAEDENGRPSIYWLSHRGPYRASVDRGVEFIGRDVRDVWATVNLSSSVGVHGIYHSDLHQVWWWIATGVGQNTPDERIVFDTRLGISTDKGVRGGWSRANGKSCEARCSVMFSNSLAASIASPDLYPHIGRVSDAGAPEIWKCGTGTTDTTATYQGYVKTKPLAPWGRRRRGRIVEPYLVAKAAAGVTIQMILDRDLNTETQSDTASIAAAASETYVEAKFESLDLTEGQYVQIQVGDNAAADNSWTIDEIVLPWQEEALI